MRTIFILFLFVILGCQGSKTSTTSSQHSKQATSTDATSEGATRSLFYKPFVEFNGDTLQYLNYNFVERKEQYVGKPFSVLYHDLEFPVKSSLAGTNHHDQLTSPSITLSFYDADTESYIMNSLEPGPTSYSVIVKWAKPVSSEALFKLDKANNWNWSPSHEAFVANEIIKDVSVLKYINPQSKKP